MKWTTASFSLSISLRYLRFSKNNIAKLFIVQSAIIILVIHPEKLLQVTIFHHNTDFSNCSFKGREVNFSLVVDIEELKRPD